MTAAAERLGVPAARILHVGDSPREDGELAREAGARFLLVPLAGVPLDALRRALESE